MIQIYPVLDFIGGPALTVLFLLFLALETWRPLRRWVQSRWERLVTNGAIAVTAAVTLRLTMVPVVVWMASRTQQLQFGLVYLFPLPPLARAILAFLLLDYTVYLWHWLNHRLPVLWRFHNVHHTDLDLDVSTAFRFHFGELLLSVFYRSAQVALIGVGPVVALVYEIMMEGATEFHHSNWRLPLGLERVLNWVVVTPRMHGIHHSIVERETNSNWSVIFSWWDRLHRTLRLDLPQQAITIGVPAYRDPRELSFFRLLTMPFRRQRSTWRLPDGSYPDRCGVSTTDRLVA
jgi:sterol desaturase/sphingolipid hydroxylase (fatty acid hydroxylase superfamily)